MKITAFIEKIKPEDNLNLSDNQFFTNKTDIIKWLDQHEVFNYIINDDLSVDVNDDVSISGRDLKAIPIKFGNVTGRFDCGNNKLTNLVGSPESVDGSFWCDGNKLINLIGSPRFVGGNFVCETCPLISLFETINCDFKKKIFFDIDEKNFKQKELIQALVQYYNKDLGHYELTNYKLRNLIKPYIEKEILQQKLIKSENKLKPKNNFI